MASRPGGLLSDSAILCQSVCSIVVLQAGPLSHLHCGSSRALRGRTAEDCCCWCLNMWHWLSHCLKAIDFI